MDKKINLEPRNTPEPCPTPEEENIYKLKEEQKYDMNVNYLEKNPYSNLFVKGTKYAGLGATLTAAVAFDGFFASGVWSACIGFSCLGGLGLFGVGIAMVVPGLIGAGFYKIYKIFKNSKCENFYKDLQTSDKMKEEREVYIKVSTNINKYFMKNIGENIKNTVKKRIECLTQIILDFFFEEEDTILNEKIENFKNIYSNIKNFNIMLVGKTGVGKSTLINGVLNLKQNEAIEGEDETPQRIEGFLKKYPINDEDTNVKGIYLWDTEGIEFSNKNKNDIETHKTKIKEYIDKHKTIPNEQINCLWYCVNGARLEDADKDYISSLLNTYNDESENGPLKSIFEDYKFPIIFIYTKAYNSEDENIEKLENAFKKLDYFINYPNELKYIDVIAKEKKYKNRRTKEMETEPKLNIKKLIDMSYENGKKGMSLPLLNSSNLLFKELNDKANKMLQNLKNISIELTKTILSSKNDNPNKIYEEAVPIFKKLIQALSQEKLDSSKIKKLDLLLEGIFYEAKELLNNNYKRALNLFVKNYFITSLTTFLSEQYDKKEDKNITFEEFKKNCIDYLITPSVDNISRYAILSLFVFFREIIFNYSFDQLNKNLKVKKIQIKETFKAYSRENYERFVQTFVYKEE